MLFYCQFVLDAFHPKLKGISSACSVALCAIYEVETGGGVRCSNGLPQEDAVAELVRSVKNAFHFARFCRTALEVPLIIRKFAA